MGLERAIVYILGTENVQESTDAKDHQVQWLIDALRQEFCKDDSKVATAGEIYIIDSDCIEAR